MSTTLGGTTLPNVNGECVPSIDGVVVQKRMADDTLRTYSSGNTKYQWSISWKSLSETDKNTIVGKCTTYAAQSFSPPDTSSSYSVQVVPGTLSTPLVKGGASTIRYDVSVTLKQV
uniref:Uncharacterized protein n=1 Tax=viral metagenome TaxID=1070528 RepID=A0A6M3LAS3_9ZZZZ